MTLQTRAPLLAAALVAAALIALCWTAVFALVEHEQELELAAARRHNDNMVLALEEHTRRTLKSVEQLLRFIAFEYRRHGRVPDLDALAAARIVDERVVFVIGVADASGRIVVARPAGGGDIADRPYFARHREQRDDRLLVSPPVRGRVTGLPSITASYGMTDAAGRFAGVVFAGLAPGYFSDYYGKLDIGRNGMIQLVGTDGIARVRRAGDVTTVGQDMRDTSLIREQAKHPSGAYLSKGKQERVPRYSAYRTLPEYGLIVAVGVSRDEVLASFARQRGAYLLSGAAVTLVVLSTLAGVLAAMRSRRRALHEQLREQSRLRATFDEAGVGIAHVALDGRVLRGNRRLCTMLGYTAEELTQLSFAELKFPEDRAAAQSDLAALLASGRPHDVERRYRRRDGAALWVALSVTIVRDPEGRPEYLVAMAQDITERKAAQEQVKHQATHDPLTGLPNRALFYDRLALALNQARRRKAAAAVLFLDLDRFKQVNDALGHAAGDELLREVARRLAACVRSGDTAARVGGDEFAVVLSEVGQAGDAVTVARKILDAMATPMTLSGRAHALTVSIGIATYPVHGEDVESLVHNADVAMFEAKRAGRNAFREYSALLAA